jgi:hypothetical protein
MARWSLGKRWPMAAPPPVPEESVPEAARDGKAEPGSPWPGICEAYSLQMLALAEQLREALDELEAREDDPGRLSQLYRIDHGVARMRRATRDLRTLAGRAEDDLAGPVTSLLDVMRVALSAIERYEQVRVGPVASLAVAGYAADDVAGLLAALLENATAYSPDEVTVSAHLTQGGEVTVRVDDSGIGMTDQQVEALNALLAGAVPELAEQTGRHTGFPVVHRIARRHQIGVRLATRPAPRCGLLVTVSLPSHLLCEVPEDEDGRQPVPGSASVHAWSPPATDLTSMHAGPAVPATLPRRESASPRGVSRHHAAGTPPSARGPGLDQAADQSLARRAFADEVTAFTQAAAGSAGPARDPGGQDRDDDTGPDNRMGRHGMTG